MARVVVTGATGLLGTSLVPLLEERGHCVIGFGHGQSTDVNIDLTHEEKTISSLNDIEPEIIVNLTALTDVDRCENNPNHAYLLNVKPVENICSWIRKRGKDCHLIHISTDHLYDGEGPHAEDKVTISNHYAMSKLASEFAALTVSSTILRTNFAGRSKRKGRSSLTDWLYTSLRMGRAINVFEDVMFSPLSIQTL
jgi:dTDP-4-dehydrorhamnose reductase